MGGQAIAFDLATGAPIDEATAAEAIASGNAGFKPNTVVYMHNPNTGRDVGVSADQAAVALQSGYQLLPSEYVAQKEQAKADREKYGGLGGTARATLEGAARGVTFGLSDLALKEAGLGEGMAERQQYSPIASTGAEIVGTVGSLFVPGGLAAKGAGATARAGQAARVATAAPRALARGAEALGAAVTRRAGSGVAARALGAGVSGAAEGAAYGAGQVISQAALRDQELTAEMLLGGAMEGAALGGLLGGGVGALGAAGAKAGGALKSRLGGKGLREFAEQEAGVAMLGASKSELRKILNRGGEERLARLGRRGLDETALMSDPRKALGVVTREAGDAVTRLKAVERQLDEAGARVAKAPIVKELDEQLQKAKQGLTGSQRDVADGLTKELEPILDRLTSGGDDLTFSEAWEFRRAIDKSAKLKWEANKPSPLSEALEDARNIFSRQLDDVTEKASPDLKVAWKKANADYSDMAAMRDVLKRRTESNLAGSLISTGDTVATAAGLGLGAMSGTPLTAMLTGAATGAANKFLRERGHEILARAANRLSKSTEAIDTAARKMTGSKLPSPARTVAPVAVPLMERYDREREKVIALTKPQTMQRALEASTRGLEHEPGLVTAMHATLASDAAYLQSQLPVERPRSALSPDAGTVPPTQAEVKSFMAKADAIADPSSVLADLADGKLDPAAIEALKVRRPKIWAELRKQAIVYAGQKSEQIPYKQKVLLSLAFDFSADSSLDPATISGIQGAYTTAPVSSGVTGIQQGFAQQDAQAKQKGSPPAPAQGAKGIEKTNQGMMLPSEAATQRM